MLPHEIFHQKAALAVYLGRVARELCTGDIDFLLEILSPALKEFGEFVGAPIELPNSCEPSGTEILEISSRAFVAVDALALGMAFAKVLGGNPKDYRHLWIVNGAKTLAKEELTGLQNTRQAMIRLNVKNGSVKDALHFAYRNAMEYILRVSGA